jgi:hypothetical protein
MNNLPAGHHQIKGKQPTSGNNCNLQVIVVIEIYIVLSGVVKI